GVGGPRIRSAWRDDRQDARRNDERLRRGVGRTLRRPNGEEPPAERDPRDPRPRGSPQVAATDGHSLVASTKPRRNADETGVYATCINLSASAKTERNGTKVPESEPRVPEFLPERSPPVRRNRGGAA